MSSLANAAALAASLLDPAAQALRRAALAVAQPGGPTLFDDLVRELAGSLGAAVVFIAVFADEARTSMRMLAARLDGRPLRNFDYPLAGSPCEHVVGREFRYAARGVSSEFPAGSIFGAKGMDSYAAYPLNDSAGTPLGLLVAMDRAAIADPPLAEAMLKIVASRVSAELERASADEALRAAALALSSARGASVFAELVRYLATILRVEIAFIARHDAAKPDMLRMLALSYDGEVQEDVRYPILHTPCATVLGQGFRAYPSGLAEAFPDDHDVLAHGTVSYAGYPLADLDGAPLGIVAIASRKPLAHVERIESMLQIFAVRAAAEIERLRADEALRRSEASYRAIFDAAEDAIFLHDWNSGAIVDANPKACRTYGYSIDELRQMPVSEIGSGVAPYTADDAQRHVEAAKLGRGAPFEWHRRNKDGSLRWDEVVLKPATINGTPYIVGFSHEITERKAAEEALKLREAQYRAVFDGSADALVLRDRETRVIDVNRAFTQMYGISRDEALGSTYGQIGLPPQDASQRSELVRRALAGEEGQHESIGLRKDGSPFDIELRYLPIQYRGEPHVLVITRDITERKAAEEALKAREEQYRVIFEASSDAFILRDAQMRVVDVNPAFLRMSGFTRDHLESETGYPPDFPPEHVAERHALVRRALAGETIHVEMTLLRGDGSGFDAEVRIIPVRYRGAPHVLSIVRDISERKQAEAALKLREEQYRVIFEASSDAFVLRDSALRIVEFNPAFEKLYGFTPEMIAGETGYPAHFPPEYVESRRAQHRRALAGEATHVETVALRADGSSFEADMRVLPVRYRGEPHVLAVVRDITERKQAEAALKLREEQYRAIFDGSADALVLWSRDVRIVDVNKAFTAMYGYTRDDVVGGSFGHRLSPQEIAERIALIERALAGEETQFETRTIGRDGRRFAVELRYLPIRHRGEPHVLAVSRDITERKAAEAALQLREQQYRAIFDGTSDAMALWSRDLRIVDVNRAFEPMFGYTREESIGAVFGQRLTQDEVERRRVLFERALAGHEAQIETESVRRNGERFDVELRYLPIQHRGEPHVLAVTRDITARRRAEAQHAELEAQLRQAQKMEAIGHLTGGIAHDFNNILTSVIGYVVLAGERAASHADARLTRQLEQAHVAAQRARDLVAQMLTFARRQRGERRVLALPALVRQTVQLLRATLPSSIELDADTDDAAAPVEADAVQIEQVLFNLCINARDAIGAKSGRIRVRLREADGAGCHCASCRARVGAGRWVELSVSDTGSGITSEVQARMFDPFFTTKDVGRGSGMGLAMVHGIVHDHGGHLCLETAAGAGSRFRVLLPPAAAQAEADAAAQAPQRAARAPLRGRVLLVEDEPMVADYMTELLDGWGLEVTSRRDALQALDWLADPAHAIDLLITDQTMPRLTGVELARRVRELRPPLPVLLYTGNAGALDPAELQACGVTQALRKPVDADVLRAALRRLLGGAAALTPLE